MEFEINAKSDYLRVIVTGDFSLEAAKTCFIEVMDAAERQNLKTILVDGRGITGRAKGMDRFSYGDVVAQTIRKYRERSIPFVPRIAHVLKPPMYEPQRYAENVARYSGADVKIFDDMQDAHDYLRLTPD